MPPPPVETKARVAVVEDDADLRDSTLDFLRALGYPAWGAEGGESFQRRLASDPVDVVVLDVELPGEDGFTIAGRLQGRADLGIVMVTGRCELDDRLTGLASGADTYLVKPVNLRELAANIDAVARRLMRPEGPPDGMHWHLDRTNWIWIGPNGASLKLTAKEFIFVRNLAEASGGTVTKGELSAELDGSAASQNFNRLDVLLSRLRKKGEQAFGQPIPIRAVTAVGYAMTARCSLV